MVIGKGIDKEIGYFNYYSRKYHKENPDSKG